MSGKSRGRKVIEILEHGKLKTNIPAGMASAGPPLGPMLGQVKFSSLFYFPSCSEYFANINHHFRGI